jgi:hypothetical protein
MPKGNLSYFFIWRRIGPSGARFVLWASSLDSCISPCTSCARCEITRCMRMLPSPHDQGCRHVPRHVTSREATWTSREEPAQAPDGKQPPLSAVESRAQRRGINNSREYRAAGDSDVIGQYCRHSAENRGERRGEQRQPGAPGRCDCGPFNLRNSEPLGAPCGT